MNTLDILILIILAFNAILGAVRGAAWQILRLASIFLGVWGAWRFGDEFLRFFPASWGISSEYGIYVARVVLFLSIYLIMFGVTNLVRSVIKKVKLGSWDRTLGAGFGVAKGALFCCIILYLQLTPIGDITVVQEQLHGSKDGSIPASRGNELFLKYARERLDSVVPDERKSDIEKLSKKAEELLKEAK